jgi:hypothetical protein
MASAPTPCRLVDAAGEQTHRGDHLHRLRLAEFHSTVGDRIAQCFHGALGKKHRSALEALAGPRSVVGHSQSRHVRGEGVAHKVVSVEVMKAAPLADEVA